MVGEKEEKKESSQEDIDALIREVSGIMAEKKAEEVKRGEKKELKEEEVEQLLKEAGVVKEGEEKAGLKPMPMEVKPLQMEAFKETQGEVEPLLTMDMLKDIELKLSVELGRCKMLIQDVLKIGRNSVIELDKLSGDPLNIYVNNKLIAKGEVLVLNDNFCIRVTEIVSPKEATQEE